MLTDSCSYKGQSRMVWAAGTVEQVCLFPLEFICQSTVEASSPRIFSFFHVLPMLHSLVFIISKEIGSECCGFTLGCQIPGSLMKVNVLDRRETGSR